MTALELLAELRGLGFETRAEGDRLLVRDVDLVPADLRHRLRDLRREVLALLRDEAGADEPPAEIPADASVRIYSKVLDCELWIAADEKAAADLHREGVTLPVILADEAKILADMAEADARGLLELLARIQRTLPDSRVRSVIRAPHDA
jgi:hypothetical protein